MFNFRALAFSIVLLSACFSATAQEATAAGVSSGLEAKPAALLKKSYDQMIDGEFRDAVDTQILAVKADKNNINARRYLSYSLLKIGASDEAIEQLHNLLSMTKATPMDMLMCGEACLQAGRLKNAERWFKEAMTADPQLASARIGLANVVAARKKAASPAIEVTAPLTEESAEAPKTTYEMGQVKPEEGTIAYSVNTAGNSDTQSYASETARMLRGTAAAQQLASAQHNAGPATNQNLGNNQVMNAWAGFKGIQRH
jgi:tetratricopeptide (TPR) repeat protein